MTPSTGVWIRREVIFCTRASAPSERSLDGASCALTCRWFTPSVSTRAVAVVTVRGAHAAMPCMWSMMGLT